MQRQAARDARWCCYTVFQKENKVYYCHVTAARFLRAGREVGWASPQSLASLAWRVIIRFTEHVSTEWRIRDTQAQFLMWNGMMGNHDLIRASWWLLPHQGKSFSDGTAAGNSSKQQVAPGTPVSCVDIALDAAQAVHKPRRTSAALRACRLQSPERLDSIARSTLCHSVACPCFGSTSFAGQQSHPMSVSLPGCPEPP
ncbi:hypothetical protein GGI43DRAFT_45839 [Trichoderma evansii]